MQVINRAKQKEALERLASRRTDPDWETLGLMASFTPVGRGISTVAKGISRFSGLSNYLKSFVPGAKTLLTSSGKTKTVIGSQRYLTVGRVEDAYIGRQGHTWPKGSKPLGWFTSDLFPGGGIEHYAKHVKDATKLIKEGSKGHYLPPGSALRGMAINMTPNAFFKYRKRLLNNAIAKARSGGMGRPTVQEEIIIPNRLVRKVRQGNEPYASVFYKRTSSDMMRQFAKY